MIDHAAITARIEALQKMISIKEKRIQKSPPGRIQVNPKDGHIYYDYIHQGLRRLKAHSKQDMVLARALTQRDYDIKVLKRAEKEIRLLKMLESFYAGTCAEDVYETLGKARRDLIEPIRLTDEQYAEKWQAQVLRKAVIPPEVETFETERGEKVRSKSEVFIANTLRQRKRKYHYECAVTVTDHLTGRKRTVYPDFYVLNPHTRKAYYWELFGKCDDPDYVNRNINKLIDYRSAGIISGVNLIMTFKTKEIPFSPKMAENVINAFLM